MPPARVILFIDYQNVYRCARDIFWHGAAPHFTDGQIDPCAMGRYIVAQGPTERVLSQVRVHLGQPSATKDPRSYAANRRQIAAWEKAGCSVFPRPLRYPWAYPAKPPQEKGIDVALAIDFISLAIDGAFDVGVLASTDTDLKPALEFVNDRYTMRCQPEVAAWSGGSRLSIKGKSIRCHWLDLSAYQQVADPTDYTR